VVQLRFLLGPAGSGKTYRCLHEIREALIAAPEGPALILLTPKQATFQIERQLLAEAPLSGYTRLHILAFDRLAGFILDQLGTRRRGILDEEGRLMVLRGLLSRKREKLQLFRASARLTGFAQQLSTVLREIQDHQVTPEALEAMAAECRSQTALGFKLQDLAALLREYLAWLAAHDLEDAGSLLNSATDALKKAAGGDASWKADREAQKRENAATGGRDSKRVRATAVQLDFREAFTQADRESRPASWLADQVWVDGFGEFSPQELDLLSALLPHCRQSTLALCLDPAPPEKLSWLSNWSFSQASFEACKRRFAAIPGVVMRTDRIERSPGKTRFKRSNVLAHLESGWPLPRPFPPAQVGNWRSEDLRVVTCADPETEARVAAHEILRHVRSGGRFRECGVIVRDLEVYHQILPQVFANLGIPLFLDRRESIAHHPLAELTRSALRTVALQWPHEDWFAALKTGLVPASDTEIDRLENEALARGWRGSFWQKPIAIPDDVELSRALAQVQARVMPPFQKLALALAQTKNRPSGKALAAAIRAFWEVLRVEEQMRSWAAEEERGGQQMMSGSAHVTTWEQLNQWLDNVELGFAAEALTLREWLPVLDAGLASLTIGLIPPAIDQVVIGGVDRSRTAEIRLALVLGMNESIFPARPEEPILLNEGDRQELEGRNLRLGTGFREQLARERFLAYIACTRASERLVLTYALQDGQGDPLNPSPLLLTIKRLYPGLQWDTAGRSVSVRDAVHPSELVGWLPREIEDGLPAGATSSRNHGIPEELLETPVLQSFTRELERFSRESVEVAITPEYALRLYGPVLRTSVSRMEQFAACPFQFFVRSGLKAEERKRFELDAREQGSFQHDVLAMFHEQLRRDNRDWRDLTPKEARALVRQVAEGVVRSYHDGLLQASDQTRFLAKVLTGSLEDFVETLVGWMQTQYRFRPTRVELPFGEGDQPPWSLDLGEGRRLDLYGRIDRVDLWADGQTDEALCVVIDYKSSEKKLDPLFLAHGLQLQLLMYLNVLRRWPNPAKDFGVSRLTPAGVFYVNLRGRYKAEANRKRALAAAEGAPRLAYRHSGRFDASRLSLLDGRPEVLKGDQFAYRRIKGGLHRGDKDPMTSSEFLALLDSIQDQLGKMGREVFSGTARLDPFRKQTVTACDQCSYQPICRIDPWTHSFRVLKQSSDSAGEEEG
jgi:ATP-dependent helicase/nuclease subunit B